jgi:hypothetical protein
MCAVLWPHARNAGAILAAQDDPAALADVRLNSALRNNRAVIAENNEAALAASDADLAGSPLTPIPSPTYGMSDAEFPQRYC